MDESVAHSNQPKEHYLKGGPLGMPSATIICIMIRDSDPTTRYRQR